MPIITTSNTKDRFTYKLYSVNEIKTAWQNFKELNKKDILGDKRFVVCRADNETEALVLAALMMRKTTTLAPSATYYNYNLKKLYLCCEYVHDMEDIVDNCRYVIKVFMGMNHLSSLEYCWRGEPLFRKIGDKAEDFYKERNFPHGASGHDYGGLGGLHGHFPPEFAGVI